MLFYPTLYPHPSSVITFTVDVDHDTPVSIDIIGRHWRYERGGVVVMVGERGSGGESRSIDITL